MCRVLCCCCCCCLRGTRSVRRALCLGRSPRGSGSLSCMLRAVWFPSDGPRRLRPYSCAPVHCHVGPAFALTLPVTQTVVTLLLPAAHRPLCLHSPLTAALGASHPCCKHRSLMTSCLDASLIPSRKGWCCRQIQSVSHPYRSQVAFPHTNTGLLHELSGLVGFVWKGAV
jgi:hypothetical protein